MKHFRPIPITTILAALLISSAAIFNACSKQESTVNPVNVQQLSPQDVKINNTIKNFRDKVAYLRENPGYKSGESYTADSALWLLEATINYSHTFPNDYYGQLITDTLNLTLATNDAGEVDMNELAQKYDEMKASISAVYHSKAIDNKGLVLVNLEDISFKSGEVNIEVVAVTGERTEGTPDDWGIDGPFEEGDDWWYGEFGGLCIENDLEDSDASVKLLEQIQLEIPSPEEEYYVIPDVEYSIQGGDPLIRRNPEYDPEDNHLDYYLYYASTSVGPCTHDTLCVEWQEMNFYYAYLKQLIYNYLPQNVGELQGLDLLEVTNIHGTSRNDNGVVKYYHELTAIYGLKVAYPDNEMASEI
jgi:hypothetical protein